MAFLPCRSNSDIGTFTTTSQSTLAVNSVINLTQQVLVGTNIFFTPPNTINLKPGRYIVNYSLLGHPTNAGQLLAIGLQLNGSIITQSTVGPSSHGAAAYYPEAVGSYLLITTFPVSTLQLLARTTVDYPTAAVNTVLTANNVQTAQLTIFRLK